MAITKYLYKGGQPIRQDDIKQLLQMNVENRSFLEGIFTNYGIPTTADFWVDPPMISTQGIGGGEVNVRGGSYVIGGAYTSKNYYIPYQEDNYLNVQPKQQIQLNIIPSYKVTTTDYNFSTTWELYHAHLTENITLKDLTTEVGYLDTVSFLLPYTKYGTGGTFTIDIALNDHLNDYENKVINGTYTGMTFSLVRGANGINIQNTGSTFIKTYSGLTDMSYPIYSLLYSRISNDYYLKSQTYSKTETNVLLSGITFDTSVLNKSWTDITTQLTTTSGILDKKLEYRVTDDGAYNFRGYVKLDGSLQNEVQQMYTQQESYTLLKPQLTWSVCSGSNYTLTGNTWESGLIKTLIKQSTSNEIEFYFNIGNVGPLENYFHFDVIMHTLT